MEKSGSIYSGSSGPLLPGICKDVIGWSLDVLGQSHEDGSAADSLMHNLLEVRRGLLAVSQAHEDQDEDSQDDRKQPAPLCLGRLVSQPCALPVLSGVV